MNKSVVLLFACSILAVACQKSGKKPAPTSLCNKDMSLNQNAPVRTETVKVHREFRKNTQTNCAGQTSTRIENLKDPKDAYSLKALTLTAGTDTYQVNAFNRTTCDGAKIKTNRKPEDTHMEIQYHTSPGTGRMHVNKNADNYIDYEFRRCVQFDATRACLRSVVAERGTVILRVEYTENEAAAVETQSDCPAKAANRH